MTRKSFLQSVVPASIATMLFKEVAATPSDIAPSEMQSTIIPPYLKPGDTVGITCPAGAIDFTQLQCCVDALQKWGLNVQYGKTVGKRWQRFGGTDEERLEDFQALIDDDNINAIMFGKGGYGTMRIIDKIKWDKFRKKPKWLVGYSDLTVVHLHVHANLNVCTIHGDMSNGFGGEPYDDSVHSLNNALFGNKVEYTVSGSAMNKPGNAKGKIIGGNLSILHACAGSKSDITTEGKILFIEDVSEYKYTIDRMMMSMKRSGKLDKLAGLIVGEFTATKNHVEETFDLCIEEIILDKIKEFNYPVCFHFPAGHIRDNRALKMGMTYNLNVGYTSTTLVELSPGFQNLTLS